MKYKSMISNAEIEELAEALVRKFLGAGWQQIKKVDIDGFLTKCLKLKIVYADFAEDDPDRIGFLSDGVMSLKVKNSCNKTVSVIYPPKTVVLEKVLLNPWETRRRRFTAAHEGGHYIISLHCPQMATGCFNTIFDNSNMYSLPQLKERFSFPESQADRMGACLLMPRFMVWEALNRENDGYKIKIFGESVFREQEKLILQKMADDFDVSFSALAFRLRELKLYQECALSDYIDNEFMQRSDGLT